VKNKRITLRDIGELTGSKRSVCLYLSEKSLDEIKSIAESEGTNKSVAIDLAIKEFVERYKKRKH
jgi:hypothetical protein